MVVKFTHGNMFDAHADVLVNTVNCVGAMGKGIALTFKKMYPKLYTEYRGECRKGNIVTGKMYMWTAQDGKVVVNFPTKDDWRKPSEYAFIDEGLADLRECLSSMGEVHVAMPPLGCGNGGLDWERVRPMILEHLNDIDAVIHVFEPRRR